ncbi:MAG: hypothetical protein KBS94_02570, partial [Prevotella sp.]|nr:hypothetical protein [Candidatus Equicola faecalis]
MKKFFTKMILLFFISMLTVGAWGAPDKDYLCIKAEEAGAKVQLTKKGSPEAVTIEYSTDEGATWTTVDFSTVVTTGDITLTNVGDKVYFRNNGTSATFSQSADNYYQFVMSGNVAASGNVMSLIDKNVESANIPCNYCFYGLFAFCKTLTNAADLKLPATTLTGRCYSNMFEFCSALTTAPALPATTLKEHCYFYMFSNCHSLEKAPELPAETLESSCYGCMFNDCHKLNYVRVGFTEWGFNATGKWLCDAGTEATNHDFACSEELNVNTRDDDHVPEGWTITHPLLDYLCITAEEADATVQLIKTGGSEAVTIEYSTDEGATWTTVDFSDVTTTDDIKLESVGHKVYFRNASEATEETGFSLNTSYYYYFTFSKKVSASGNVMSLIDKKVKTTKIMQHCFNHLFYNCDNLINAANLKLPATTLAGNCYSNMFEGCKTLTTAPALPATTLERYCYENMFNGCTALTTAPALPATTLAENCYQNMFNGCTALTTVPALPAKELEGYCYDGMFKGCTALATSIELPAEKLKKKCYNEMFYDCKKLNHVKVGFTKWGNMDDQSSDDYEATHSWLASTGDEATDLEFVCPEGLDMNTPRDDSHVPDKWTITRTSLDYLCITAEEAGAKVQLKKNGSPAAVTIGYSRDGGATWTTVDFSTVETTGDITLTNVGDKVYFRNNGTSATFSQSADNYYQFVMSGNVAANGNVMSLIDKYMDSTTIPCNYCFYSLFRDCTNLMNVANLKLPATTLAEDCYDGMFWGCSTLETAPALPATTLASSCYQNMFQGCTALTTAPALPAMTLAESCYNSMFQKCEALETVPALPATTLAENCYQGMFLNCISLEAAPALPAETLMKNCYREMFEGCTALTKAPELPATALAEVCYYRMFLGCTALTDAPALPATTLVRSCYNNMYNGCTALEIAPELPATTLAESCYNSMFQGCLKLRYVKVGFTDWSEGKCTLDWLRDAGTTAINRTFECSEVLDMNKRDNSHVPSNWTIKQTSPAYLCIKAEEAGAKVRLKKNGSPAAVTIGYSRDGGTTWTTVDFSTVETTGDITLTNVGDKVYFRNNGTSATFSQSADNYYQFVMSGNVAASGNVMSLIDNNMESTTIPCNYCFYNLFNNCTELINAANLKLPATTLTEACYQNMFEDCISLEVAPALPAETLVKNCYNKMFEDCISLEAAPALPATTLAEACYKNMFSGCIALTAAPELKTTTLAENCYGGMFLNCISLEAAPALPAETLMKNCYREMFEGCTALTKAPELPATTLADVCYYRMFLGCTALTAAPALPATTLVRSCYNNMFNGCTALEIAPELPATTLAEDCYNSMFQGCEKLNYVKVGFKGWGEELCTGSWLSNAGKKAENKIFVCPEELDVNTRDDNHVPNGWMIMTGIITLDDNDPYNVTIDIEDVKLKYKRTFAEVGKYEALYLPFSVTMTNELLDQVTIAKIYMVSTKGSVVGGAQDAGVNVVVLKTLGEGESTKPHTPYFIRLDVETETESKTDLEFTQEHTDIYAATNAQPGHIDCSTIIDKYNFIGNYEGKSLTPEAGKSIYVLQGGALHKVTSETDLHCNRWQMVKTP